jgi:DNA-binding transcriptional ArsR family regulator
MEEKRYRESRLCRLLGNPIVYQIVLHLEAGGPLTPSKLAKLIGRQISTVSIHLGKLRAPMSFAMIRPVRKPVIG